MGDKPKLLHICQDAQICITDLLQYYNICIEVSANALFFILEFVREKVKKKANIFFKKVFST